MQQTNMGRLRTGYIFGPSIRRKHYIMLRIRFQIQFSRWEKTEDTKNGKIVQSNALYLLLQHTIVLVQRHRFQNKIQFFNSATIETIHFVLWLSWLKICLRKKSETELDGIHCIRKWILFSDWLRKERRKRVFLWHLTLSHSFTNFTSWTD